VTRRTTLAYGLPGFALALFGVPVYVHLPKFYADVVGAPLGALGAAILITRAWDALLDPLVGAWSDRVRSPWGRRLPFLWIAPVPMALAVVALFAPPAGLSPAASAWWFTAAMTLGFVGWTAVYIPHAALGPELAAGYHERTTLFAVRDGLWIFGTLAAAAAPAVARAAVGADERTVFRAVGLVYAVLLVALPWVCAANVRERPVAAAPATPPRASIAAGAREALQNRPFRILLAAYAIGSLGAALPGTLIFFYVEHVIGAPELGDLFLGIYFLTGFLCLPGWTWAARRHGKKTIFLTALFLSTLVFMGAFFLGRGDTLAYGLICLASGAGFGASLVLPASMQADTIDYDELRSGTRREGLYIGLWSVASKGAAAIGAGVALPVIGAAGYVAGTAPPALAIETIRWLYCAIPCICYLSALVVVYRYPIDQATHTAISAAISSRAAGLPFHDPLAGS